MVQDYVKSVPERKISSYSKFFKNGLRMVAEQNPIMAWSLATKLSLRFYVALSPFPM